MEEEKIDGISQLPEDVLIRILSLVPTKEVVRARLVSKLWRKLFEFLPSFTFAFAYPRYRSLYDNTHYIFSRPPFHLVVSDRHPPPPYDNTHYIFSRPPFPFVVFDPHPPPPYDNTDDISSLITVIDSALKLHKDRTLDELKLWLDLNLIGSGSGSASSSRSLVESWIDAALERKVRSLDLTFQHDKVHLDPIYLLPLQVLSARTITDLCLDGCILKIGGDARIDLPALRKLSLTRIDFEEDEETIHKLISSCHSIQDLNISRCNGIEWLNISGFDNLQRLTIYKCSILQTIEIDAPALQYFHHRHHRYGAWQCEYIFPSSPNEFLQKLILYDDREVCFTEDFLQSLAYRFPNLEELDILSGLGRIEISHHRLKRLYLRPTKAEAMLKIDTPNLQSLRYKGYRMPLVSAIPSLNTSSSLRKIDIKFRSQYSILQLKEFFEKIRHCQDMKLHLRIKSKLHLNIPGKPRPNISPPVYDIKHLKLTVDYSCEKYQYIIDRLFWMCHPQTLTISSRTISMFLKVLYNKFKNKEKHPKCCASCTTKCWRHYLEEVQIDGDESKEEIDRIMTMPKLSMEFMDCKVRFILKWRS